jgi:Cytochrome b5-like Heme/Steroid binding domain
LFHHLVKKILTHATKKYTTKQLCAIPFYQLLQSILTPAEINVYMSLHPYLDEIFQYNAWGMVQYLSNYETKKYNTIVLQPSYQEVVMRMKEQYLSEDKIHLLLNHRVLDISYDHSLWSVKCMNEKTVKGRILFQTTPPNVFSTWPYFAKKDFYQDHLSYVPTESLLRMYAFCDEPSKECVAWLHRLEHRLTNSFLCQVIAVQPEKGVFQISYSSAQQADLWKEYMMKGYDVKGCMIHILQSLFPNDFQASWITRIQPFYWKHAVHIWAPGCHPQEEILFWTKPQEDRPLYMANEAFSSVHGWCEGALESVERALLHYRRDVRREKKGGEQKAEISLDEVKKHHTEKDAWIAIEGNVYNITKWIPLHPGGPIIMKYMGTDATKAFHAVGHPAGTLETIGKKYWIGKLKK